MEFIVEKNDIVKTFSKVQGIIEKRGINPILSNVLIKGFPSSEGTNKLEILATDLEISIRVFCNSNILSEGSITISGRKIYEIVKELPEASILFKEKENGQVEVSCGKVIYNLPTLPPQEFPVISFFEGIDIIKVSSKILHSMIEKTVFAVSKDETKYILNSFFIEENNGLLTIVATDGYRLSLVNGELVKGGIREGILIPKRAFIELRKLLDTESEEVLEIGFKENMCIINFNDTALVVRLIEGEFPDYRQVIERDRNNVIRVKKEDFKKALKRISIVSDEKDKIVKFHITKSKLEFSSEYPAGEAKEEIEVDANIVNEFSILFNATYFLDALNVIDEDEVIIEFEDEETSSLLKPVDDANYINIIMPIRL
jgi:DNA polymerase-3 subunit beta